VTFWSKALCRLGGDGTLLTDLPVVD